MNILYISYDGMTDPLGQSQVLPYLAGLSAGGNKIFLISAEKPHPYLKEKQLIETFTRINNIEWYPVKYTKWPPVFSTLSDLYRIIRLAEKLHRQYSLDVVHCRSYIAAFAGLQMKKKFKTRFIFDMRGFWADERVEGGIWNLKNPVYRFIYKYFKKKEIEFLSAADCIVSLTFAGKEFIENPTNKIVLHSDIQVIPCCADLDHFSSRAVTDAQKEILRKELHLVPDDFVVSYLGSLGTWYMLDEMLLFFSYLFEQKPSSKLLCITKDNPEKLFLKARELGIPETAIRIRSASRNEVPSMISLSHFSLFFIKPVFSKKASSPTKLGEILGMGVPVICNSGVGDVDIVMQDICNECLVHDFSPSSLQKTALHVANHKPFNPEMLRMTAMKYFSLEKGIGQYLKIYKSFEIQAKSLDTFTTRQ